MRVIAVDIDGVLAHTGEEIDRRLVEEFGGVRAELEQQPEMNDDLDKFLFSKLCFGDPTLWWAAEPDKERIAYLQKWALEDAWAPALITSRPLNMMPVTEMWLAQHGVPYGTLLMDASGKKKDFCYHLGATLLIEDDYWAAYDAAATSALNEDSVPLTSYVVKTFYNEKYVGYAAPRLQFIESFQEIKEHQDAISKV